MPNIMPIRPPEELRKSIKDEANRLGISANALVLQILWSWAEKKDGKRGVVRKEVK